MSSGLGERTPEKVVRLKVRKASKDVKAHSDECSGQTRRSERAKVWDPLLGYYRELRGILGE